MDGFRRWVEDGSDIQAPVSRMTEAGITKECDRKIRRWAMGDGCNRLDVSVGQRRNSHRHPAASLVWKRASGRVPVAVRSEESRDGLSQIRKRMEWWRHNSAIHRQSNKLTRYLHSR